jgi:hypothetical protein
MCRGRRERTSFSRQRLAGLLALFSVFGVIGGRPMALLLSSIVAYSRVYACICVNRKNYTTILLCC